MGIKGADDLTEVCHNRGKFDSGFLFNKAIMFLMPTPALTMSAAPLDDPSTAPSPSLILSTYCLGCGSSIAACGSQKQSAHSRKLHKVCCCSNVALEGWGKKGYTATTTFG